MGEVNERDRQSSTVAEVLVGGATLIAAPMILNRSALAITPDEMKKRGKIIVGIQGDNPPWGFVNSSGVQEGFDARWRPSTRKSST